MRARAAFLAGGVLVCACHGSGHESPGAAASATALAAPPAPAPPPAPEPSTRFEHHPPTSLPCRIVALDGDVRAEPVEEADAATPALAAEGTVPDAAWIAAGPRARLVAKDARTTRETSFFGPGRFRPCVGRHEESWIASGRFESATGAGESPGAEEWVVTPLAVVRYNAVKMRVEVSARATAIHVESGAAFVLPADDSSGAKPEPGGEAGVEDLTDRPWRRLGGGSLTLSAAAGAAPAARPVVDACAGRAREAEDIARTLFSRVLDAGSLAGSLGEQAAAHVRARRVARATCAIAELRVALSPAGDARRAMESELRESTTRWSSVPATSR